MTLAQVAEKVHGTILVPADGEIEAFYAGDFLSRVMGRAPAGCAWFTVMANVNVAGVAVLAEVRAVVLCEDVSPDPLLVEKLKSEGIGLVATACPVFEACAGIVT